MANSILIVDDQREVIRVLLAALATLDQPFKITGVPSAEEGLMEARLNHVDLLVTDIRLPGMSGLDLLDRLRRLRPGIKTILMTGVTDPEVRAAAARAGADALFIKPVPVADFLAAVEQVLGLVASGAVARPEVPDDDADRRISDRLARLRQDLDAESAVLVNESGQVLVRAGTLRDPQIEAGLMPGLMASYSSGHKVSQLLGSARGDNMYFYRGESTDLVLAPIGGAYALLIAAPLTIDAALAARFHLAVEGARREIAGLLEKMGVPLTPEVQQNETLQPAAGPAEQDPIAAVDLDDALGSLLARGSAGLLGRDADQFWEPDEEQSGIGTLNADALTYDQARRLGLAPNQEGSTAAPKPE